MTALQKSCPAEKNMRMAVNTQLNMSWQCVQVAKKTNAFLACIRYAVASRIRTMITLPYLALVRLLLKSCVLFWAPHSQKDAEVLE